MGKEQAQTRNGHNLFEISSLIQKALRRSDKNMALYAAAELVPKYRNYLWKRLLTVSAEDCHDMVTHKIISFRDKDICSEFGYSNKPIECALSLLLAAQKNRDGDYYACNLLNSRDKISFPSEYGEETFDPQSATKNGHNCFYLRDVFNKAVDNVDYSIAGYCANEIRVYYPKFCWDMIVSKSASLGYPLLHKEVVALKEADKQTGYDNTLLFRSKAIILIIGAIKFGDIDYFVDNSHMSEDIDLSKASSERLRLPDYVFDCHTWLGKKRGKTKAMFVKEEHEALKPFKEGVFDSATWDRFFYLCENGFYTEEYTPHPSEDRVKEIENNKTPSLFDL